MTEPDVDPVRAFTDALTPAARHAFDHHDVTTILAVRTAVENGMTPAELARICSVGINRHSVNGRGLVKYRLLREAGQLVDEPPLTWQPPWQTMEANT